ncbi:DEAD/DEAH box helicase, partial [bacterium]|nr:DEAD/DEAH box helicase [bacterium]
MDVFDFRSRLVRDYRDYVESFIQIKDPRIYAYVHQILDQGELWPEPLIQLNPAFEPGAWIDELVDQHILHPLCKNIFRRKTEPSDLGRPLQLYQHQTEAIKIAQTGHSYVLTTGTGSGKSLAYIIPIVNAILCRQQSKGIKAIIIYPMNALANSQYGELEKFIHYGFTKDEYAIRFAKYTGEVKDE